MKLSVAKSIFFTFLILIIAGCGQRTQVETDPLDSNFFEIARLIMLDEEVRAYGNLPDKEAKNRFMEEFWKKRDPDPATSENEFRQEFLERIEQANELFGYGFGRRGMNTGRGWNSDQGRIYLVLGPPDRVRQYRREVDPAMRSGAEDPRRGQLPETVQIEEWLYERYSSPIEFERASRGWNLGAQTPAVLSIIQEAKEDLISPELASFLSHSLSLVAVYKEGGIDIDIPTYRLNYKEEGEYLKASVKVVVEVIFEGKKLEEFALTKDFSLTETELLERSFFEINISYLPTEKGFYKFNLLVVDMMSMTISQFRCQIQHKHK